MDPVSTWVDAYKESEESSYKIQDMIEEYEEIIEELNELTRREYEDEPVDDLLDDLGSIMKRINKLREAQDVDV